MADIDLRGVETMTQALRRCVDASGLADKFVADELGIKYGHFTRMMLVSDPRNLPQEKIAELMRVCGNIVPLEWLAMQMNFSLHESSLHEVLLSLRDALKQGPDSKFSVLTSMTFTENRTILAG